MMDCFVNEILPENQNPGKIDCKITDFINMSIVLYVAGSYFLLKVINMNSIHFVLMN